MNSIQKRFLLFIFGCIPARLGLAAVAKYLPRTYLRYLGFLTLIPAIGFIYLYFTGKRQVGLETQGAPIWWAPFRLFHGLMYLTFSFFAIYKNPIAYMFIVVDTFIGLALFLINHLEEGNFSKLF
jgi:hypothetical protein